MSDNPDDEELEVVAEMEEMEEIIAGRIARNKHLQNSWAQRIPVLQVMAHLGSVC